MSRKVTALGVVLVALAFASHAAAQIAPARYLQLTEINVKSGSETQFESYAKKIREAADKLGSRRAWTFAQPVVGAETPTYYVIFQYGAWAERNSWQQIPEVLTKAFGEAEAQKIMKVGGESIWGSKSTVYTLDEDRSWNLSSYTEATPYYMILRGMVKPDRVGDYQRVIARLKEAQEKAPRKVAGIRRSSTYGPSWEFYLAVPMKSWADLDEQDGPWQNAARAFGEAEARALQSTLRECYEKRSQVVMAIRQDLSRTAPSSTNDN